MTPLENILKLFTKSRKYQILIICILVTIPYLNIFRNDFVLDDRAFFVNWDSTQSILNLPSIMRGDLPAGHEGVYRPVANIFVAIYRSLWGQNIFFYHLTSIIYNLINTVLVFLIVKSVTKNKLTAFLGALFFGLHPLHIESITYITGSGGALASIFFFSAFYLYIKARESRRLKKGIFIISLIFSFLAFFTYEITFILPFILLLYEFFIRKRGLKISSLLENLKVIVPFFALAVLNLTVKFFLVSQVFRGGFVEGGFYQGVLLEILAVGKYISLLILPVNQSYNPSVYPGIEAILYRNYNPDVIKSLSLFNLQILFWLIVILSISFFCIKFYKKYPLYSFGWFFFLTGLLPTSTLIPQSAIMQERFLFIPSFGFFLISAGFFSNLYSLYEKKRKYLSVFFCISILVLGYLTFMRNLDWRNDLIFWSKEVSRNSGGNAYGFFQLGNAYLAQGNYELSIQNYRKAYVINKYFTVASASIGRVYEMQGRADLAQEQYKKVIEADPSFWEGYRNLGKIYIEKGDLKKARESYQQALDINPQLFEARTILEQIDQFKEDKPARSVFILNGNIYSQFISPKKVIFTYPPFWKLRESNGQFKLTDQEGSFQVIINDSKEFSGLAQDFLNQQTESFGLLSNQGLAQIPQFEFSYVKVWNDHDIQKLQFFLFKGNKVVTILVFPSDSEQMKQFDSILGSIDIN